MLKKKGNISLYQKDIDPIFADEEDVVYIDGAIKKDCHISG